MGDFMGFLAGVVFGACILDAAVPLYNNQVIASRAAIEDCEKNLPRNQKCEITAIVKVDNKDAN